MEIDQSDRLRCDSIVDEYHRLAADDLVDLVAMRRVGFLHDVAINVVRSSERETAIRDLFALEDAMRSGPAADS
ncbi:MAG: hypothetical protein HKN07_02465 [Acidimicrobiia bacterium]|nr:hypothetical protein [Acidimicrobiia bacterium]RZV43375.1 MAG: hypothetical protein EX269_13380 [Acidimicrobiales bacterium]